MIWQVKLAMDDATRLKVVRRMYEIRFEEPPPANRSVEQLRGIEGSRVRRTYELLAQRYGVTWDQRSYDRGNWSSMDVPNRCLSTATSCLYGICEAAVLAAGYAPAVGFLHTGKPLSFVYDVADLVKFQTVVPVAFKVAAMHARGELREDPGIATRRACRDAFRKARTIESIVSTIEDVLASAGVPVPGTPVGSLPVAFEEERTGDQGHR